jgi:short-subunit dehydrogenase
MKNLKDKKIIITGADGGLGSLVAKLLAQENSNLTLMSFNEDGLQKICNEIKLQNGKAGYIKADFSSVSGIKEAAEIISEIDDIYMIIHLAGIMSFDSLGMQKPENIEMLYNINLLAPVLLTKAILPEMIKNKSGHVVNVGSIFGSIAFPYYATYSSSKAAIRGFSEALSRELDGTGVNVSYVAPRTVRTSMNGGKIANYVKRTKANIDEPEDVALKIIKAIKKEKKFSYFGFPESLFVRINYLFPSLVSKALKKQTAIAREILMND